ncbi:MAG TPA: hypothetical protein VN848_06730 [Gemmatimonadales bacterium]|nr:hypothetical protein [Gemmatimonadales bacterium]
MAFTRAASFGLAGMKLPARALKLASTGDLNAVSTDWMSVLAVVGFVRPLVLLLVVVVGLVELLLQVAVTKSSAPTTAMRRLLGERGGIAHLQEDRAGGRLR